MDNPLQMQVSSWENMENFDYFLDLRCLSMVWLLFFQWFCSGSGGSTRIPFCGGPLKDFLTRRAGRSRKIPSPGFCSIPCAFFPPEPHDDSPLVNVYSLLLNMPIEIVDVPMKHDDFPIKNIVICPWKSGDFPIKKWWFTHSNLLVYQRVSHSLCSFPWPAIQKVSMAVSPWVA